jgi:3-methyladenine DNA glycosylase Tag
MIGFEEIRQRAVARVGAEALQARLPVVKSADELRAVADDRYLSEMSRRIFRAGLKYTLVDGKWPAFEEVFQGFEPARIRAMPDDVFEATMNDTRLIRHWGKIKSIRVNAEAIQRVVAEHGTMGAYLAAWPGADVVGLWADIGKRFSQMGGNSAPYFLRMVGKDTFVLTDAVVNGLQAFGVLDSPPKSKKGAAAAQAAFNVWAEETGRPLAHLSMTLAAAVD